MASENLGQESDIARWDELGAPPGRNPGFHVGDSDQRAALVKGLRDLADYLELRPEIPAPDTDVYVNVYADGTAAQVHDQVDYAGRLLDTPVVDDTARGGFLYAERNFGPVSYGFIGADVGAAFTVGQDVRLTPDESREAENAGHALAGTVIGLHKETDGTYTYTVQFPGDHGTRHGMTEDLLKDADSPAVRLQGGNPMSIKDAEEFLIEASVRYSLNPKGEEAAAKEKFKRVMAGMADACGISQSALIRQLEPKIDHRQLELTAAKSVRPTAVAAKDNPGPLITSLTNVEIDLPGHMHAELPAQQSRRSGPKP